MGYYDYDCFGRTENWVDLSTAFYSSSNGKQKSRQKKDRNANIHDGFEFFKDLASMAIP